MEYDELKSMWEQYNSKLDNLEKLNKKIILENLSGKPKRKISWIKFQSIYGLLAVPIILAVALYPTYTTAKFDWKFISGALMILAVVIYITYYNYKGYMTIKSVNISTDPILESVKKIIAFKEIFKIRWKSAFFYYPVISAGVILLGWDRFYFNTSTIIYLVVFFIITYLMNIFGPKNYTNRLSRLEKDILELKEYTN